MKLRFLNLPESDEYVVFDVLLHIKCFDVQVVLRHTVDT